MGGVARATPPPISPTVKLTHYEIAGSLHVSSRANAGGEAQGFRAPSLRRRSPGSNPANPAS